MEIIGKIILIEPIQSGISKSTCNQWQSQSFIIETLDNYPRKVCIDLYGEQRVKDFRFDLGEIVRVSYDLESREFNGRWYTSVRAWKVSSEGSGNVTNEDDGALPEQQQPSFSDLFLQQ